MRYFRHIIFISKFDKGLTTLIRYQLDNLFSITVNTLIWSKFEPIRDVMPLLTTWKFQEALNKREVAIDWTRSNMCIFFLFIYLFIYLFIFLHSGAIGKVYASIWDLSQICFRWVVFYLIILVVGFHSIAIFWMSVLYIEAVNTILKWKPSAYN